MLWLNVFNVELFTKRKTELKSLVCRVVLTHFEGMAGLNVTDVRREIIPLLWNIVRERALAIFFFFFFLNMRRYKISVCLLKNGAARNGLHSGKVREISRTRVREVVTYCWQFAIYSGLDRQPVKSLKKRLHPARYY